MKKGYQPDEDEQWRRSSAGEEFYTLGSALSIAIAPAYEWYLKETGCRKCAAEAAKRDVAEILDEAIEGCFSGAPVLCKEHQNEE